MKLGDSIHSLGNKFGDSNKDAYLASTYAAYLIRHGIKDKSFQA